MKQGWEIKKLKDVILEIKDGGTPSRTKPEYFGGNVNWCVVKDILPEIHSTKETLTELGLSKCSAKVWPINSVIISLGATIGQVGIAKIPVATKQGISGIIVNEKLVKPELLVYYLNFKKEFIQNAATGATIKEIRPSKLAEILEFPLPPLPEQQRIVAFLDEAFAAIARAKAHAEQNLQNAKALFESYLQGVFSSGEWEKKQLKELTTILGDGLHGTPKYSTDGEYYFINGNNLSDGKIEIKGNTKQVDVSEYHKHKKTLTDRTVLVSINGTLGNVAFYNGEKIILGKSACYFNLKETVDKGFIKYVLSSRYFLDYAHREATGATIKNVSLKSMRQFEVPFPPLETQQTIVRQLDALRAETQRLEAVYRQKLEDLEELKKSVLAKAFRGELL